MNFRCCVRFVAIEFDCGYDDLPFDLLCHQILLSVQDSLDKLNCNDPPGTGCGYEAAVAVGGADDEDEDDEEGSNVN